MAMDPSKAKQKKEDPTDFYTRLINYSYLINGDHGILSAELDILNSDLNDTARIEEGKDFVRRNIFSVVMATMASLLWLFTIKPVQTVLLRTGESHVKDRSLTRYLSTAIHLLDWYENNCIDPADPGTQDLRVVRKMHAGVRRTFSMHPQPALPDLNAVQRGLFEAVKKELATVDDSNYPDSALSADPVVPMSQLDMALTQFCFLGFLILMPERFGISDRKGMDGFVHLWAIYGRQLGMEDRFNLALHYRESNGDLSVFRMIFQDLYLPSLKRMNEATVLMWDSFVLGSSCYMKGVRLIPHIKFLLVHVGGSADKGNLRAIMSLWDTVNYAIMIILFKLVSKSVLVRNWMNQLMVYALGTYGRAHYLPNRKPNKLS